MRTPWRERNGSFSWFRTAILLAVCAPGIVTYASETEDFTLAGADIYFADTSDVIWRVPKVGGTSPVQVVRAPGAVLWMKAEDSRLYFAAFSSELTADIYFVPIGGETITTVASGLLTPIAFKTDGQFIYALSMGTPSVMAYEPAGKWTVPPLRRMTSRASRTVRSTPETFAVYGWSATASKAPRPPAA